MDWRSRIDRLTPAQVIIGLVVFIILVGSLVGLKDVVRDSSRNNLIGNKNSSDKVHLSIDKFVPFIPETFKVVLEYDTNTEKIALKEFSSLTENIRMDPRLAAGTVYQMEFLDQDGKSLIKEKVWINEVVLYRPPQGGGIEVPDLPTKLESYLYFPYDGQAAQMRLFKKEEVIFSIPITQGIAVTQKERSSSIQECGSIPVVIVSEGYKDMAEFKRHSEEVKRTLYSVTPFKPGTFSFSTYESKGTDCGSTLSTCFGNSALKKVIDIAKKENSAQMAIVLLKGQKEDSQGMSTIGPGLSMINTVSTGSIGDTAIHEFLGHAVGKLYDRYISNKIVPKMGSTKSNCSKNKEGENFWKKAGSDKGYPGCGRTEYYAPFENTCSNNGGRTDTSMGNCAYPNAFDSVERYWIANYILPELTCTEPPDKTAPPVDSGSPDEEDQGSGDSDPGGGSGGVGPGGGGGGSCSAPKGYSITSGMADNLNYPGGDYGGPRTWDSPSPQDCQIGCAEDDACMAWTWVKPGVQKASGVCYLKSGAHSMCYQDCNTVSGAKPADINNKCPIGPHGSGGSVPKYPGDSGSGSGGSTNNCSAFPGGQAGCTSWCQDQGAQACKSDCSACYCTNGKPWPNSDGNCSPSMQSPANPGNCSTGQISCGGKCWGVQDPKYACSGGTWSCGSGGTPICTPP